MTDITNQPDLGTRCDLEISGPRPGRQMAASGRFLPVKANQCAGQADLASQSPVIAARLAYRNFQTGRKCKTPAKLGAGYPC